MPRLLKSRRLASKAAPIMLRGGPYDGLRVLWRPGEIARAYSFDDGPRVVYRLRGDGCTAKVDRLAEHHRIRAAHRSPPG